MGNATVPDTDAESNIGDTATEAGADELAGTHIFYPVVIETGDTWNHWAFKIYSSI